MNKKLCIWKGGFLCVYGFGGGWPSIFYIFGIVGIVWFVLWMILAAKSPEDHRFISDKERDYIVDQTKEGLSGKKDVYIHK
jgi:ACS family sodium-dependent inorganic phosphate cotransporter-like MFS transporter 5